MIMILPALIHRYCTYVFFNLLLVRLQVVVQFIFCIRFFDYQKQMQFLVTSISPHQIWSSISIILPLLVKSTFYQDPIFVSATKTELSTFNHKIFIGVKLLFYRWLSECPLVCLFRRALTISPRSIWTGFFEFYHLSSPSKGTSDF